MTAAQAVQAAAVASLAARPDFAVTGMFDGASSEAAFPYATIGEGTATDWSATGLEGREVALSIVVWDEPGRAARLHGLAGVAEAGLLALSGMIGGGWRIAGVRLVRSRIVRDGARAWAGVIEVRVRTVRAS